MADLSSITSVTITSKAVFGNKRVNYGYITLGDGAKTVPAAGLAVTSSQLGLGTAETVQLSNKLYPYQWASEVLYSGSGASVPASGDTVEFMAIGVRQNK